MKFRTRTSNEVISVVFVLGLAACSGSSESGGVYQGGGGGKGGKAGGANCASKTTCFEKCTCEGTAAQACLTQCNSSGGGGPGGAGGAGQCGNNRIEGSEQCDGADLRGETCQGVTMGARPGGALACTTTCTFDVTRCTGGAGTGGAAGMGGGGAGGIGGGVGGQGP